ncbi:hypothetical protein BBJ28_00026211 [Nothophytophthora sp. Chile5]|nr:hypothetical protein BBJ28_00026211 [Nothophytophthora sp. Chile5]
MPRRLSWNNLANGLPRADTDMLLESFKNFTVAKSDVGQCSICSDASPHAMRTQLLRCGCDKCTVSSPALRCPWRGRVRSCQLLDVVNVDELNAHVTPVRAPTPPRLTPPMKDSARDWAKQGLRPARIWHSLIQRFNLDETTAPSLSVVQRFVHHYVAKQLGGSDLIAAVSTKARNAGFTGDEEETAAFTFSWRTDREGKPVIGNGSDANPFVLGISTKKLLRQADRDPSSFVLHLDATYKLTQVGYPVIVAGISDQARRFHLLAVFIISQQQQAQYTEVLSLLARVFASVTGNPLRVKWGMGDADVAQWNALQEVFGGEGSSFRFLMCLFHVAKKVYEKIRALDAGVGAMVLRHVHELHFSRSESEFYERLAEVQAEWSKWCQLEQFAVYFNAVWLNGRIWRWQCYHTPSGFAATNNPCEAFNASIKRDVTLRRKLKVGALVDRLQILCRAESVRGLPFLTAPAFDDRLVRRTNALVHAGLLRECKPERSSIAYLLGNTGTERQREVVNVVALPGTRVYDVHDRRSREDLPVSAQIGVETARMEHLGMPRTGWQVDVEARTCPCRAFFKGGCCVHLLFALGAVGGVDSFGRETLVYRGPNNRRRSHQSGQTAGRPRRNGPALLPE